MTTINVTQMDIDVGRQNSCTQCPIARAVRRMFPACDVSVATFIRTWNKLTGENWREVLAPARALVFMADFDNGEEVQPFSFEVEL